jgi:3-oxoacyl-[acyl-carrier protein] reductase
MRFTGRNVLITGASRGIGAAIAKVLANYGLKVWINYRNGIEQAENLKSQIESSGGVAAIIKFDATNEDDFVSAIKCIVEADGSLDYLVNNAGITNDKISIKMKVDDFENVIKANLTSAFIGCREAFKVMSKSRFGSVVNISSIVGESGNAGQVNYSASKGGLNTLTKSFAIEGASRNIRFNSVAPGFINTDMTEKLKDEVKQAYIDKIPLKRFAEPIEVAQSVAFLLSDSSSYITGEVLRVNGGMYM